MRQVKPRNLLLGSGIAVTLLALAFGMSLIFGGETDSGDGAIEPLDDASKEPNRPGGL